eukprot:c6214_g1_i1 orf=2-775(-)
MMGSDQVASPRTPFDSGFGIRSQERLLGSAVDEDSASKMTPRSKLRLHCQDEDCLDPFGFSGIQFLLGQTNKQHALKGKAGRSVVGKGSLDGKRRHGSKRKGRVALTYLKPGALAQLRDAQRSARAYCSYVEKKKGINDDRVASDPSLLSRADSANLPPMHIEVTPGPSVRVFGPLCPQRKKLVAPKTPLSPANANPVGLHTPNHAVAQSASESPLESLPLELLVRIICALQHDQLKPAFHVCKRIRQAVLIARQCHF